MAIKRVYKNTMLSSQYIFKNGKAAHFTNGRYSTDDAQEIFELDAEIKLGVPHIYIDPADSQEDSGLQDFVRQAQIAATIKAVADYEKAQKEASEHPELPMVDNSFAAGPTGIPEESVVNTANLKDVLANRVTVANTLSANSGVATSNAKK